MPPSVGRYRVERELGRGAMGTVYLAHDPVIDRKVAIKLVRLDLLDRADAAEYLARFRREAQAAARCAHPNIVAIYDFAAHQGHAFLAMEYVAGQSLADALRRQIRFAPDEAVTVLGQVLDGLACAHAVGVVHRDVKPANILLLAGNRVKMTDFGIARFDSSELTQHGAMIGTPSYMSPEQCRGDPLDARSDLFSAGVVLHEMLTGTRPFGRGGASEVMLRVVQQDPPLPEGLPPWLAAVLRQAMAKRPQDRFASAAAMAQALRAPGDATMIACSPGTTSRSMATGAPVGRAEAARAEQELAQFLGPIARVLVRRALATAQSPAALWESLAGQIERPADRAAFLKRRGG